MPLKQSKISSVICFGSWIKEQVTFLCSALVSVHGLKNELIFMCSALVSAHVLKDVMCSALVSAHGIKESWYFAYRSRKIQVMTFVLRCRFQWLTNRLATFHLCQGYQSTIRFRMAYKC